MKTALEALVVVVLLVFSLVVDCYIIYNIEAILKYFAGPILLTVVTYNTMHEVWEYWFAKSTLLRTL